MRWKNTYDMIRKLLCSRRRKTRTVQEFLSSGQEIQHHIQVVVTEDKKFTHVRKRLAFKMDFLMV